MLRTLALVTLLHGPSPNTWFGADKVKHFFMSAFVQSAAFSAARAARLDRSNAHAVGGVTTLTVGVWKEMRDRRARSGFSVTDLVWDAVGGAAAASLLNGTR